MVMKAFQIVVAEESNVTSIKISGPIDETAVLFDRISVSAGARGTQLILSPSDYLRAAQALDVEVQTADLTKASHHEGNA